MKIELKEITVGELTNGFEDNGDAGVRGYGGNLDIRPMYQREFIYKDKQRDAVIETVWQGFPLNVMYWAAREDGTWEVIDGQQRTISLCQYVVGQFAYMMRYFHNLQDDEQRKILNYKLMVYVCEGTDSERLNWFKTINIAGEKLTDQELRNAVYAGAWTSDAKRYFSKNGCVAWQIGKDYLPGSPIRQDFLETAIKWISEGHVEGYMAKHQHDANALALWQYFQSVITWVQGVFTHKRKEMKGVEWGTLYRKFKDKVWDASAIEAEVAALMADSDVKNKKGIYTYILTRDESCLEIRTFEPEMRREAYERQKGICANPQCPEKGRKLELEEMEADHIVPWAKHGRTIAENCQMLCRMCNRRKSGK